MGRCIMMKFVSGSWRCGVAVAILLPTGFAFVMHDGAITVCDQSDEHASRVPSQIKLSVGLGIASG